MTDWTLRYHTRPEKSQVSSKIFRLHLLIFFVCALFSLIVEYTNLTRVTIRNVVVTSFTKFIIITHFNSFFPPPLIAAARAMEAEEDSPLVLDPLAASLAGTNALNSARSRQQPAPKHSGRKIKINMMAIRTRWFDDQLQASLGMPVAMMNTQTTPTTTTNGENSSAVAFEYIATTLSSNGNTPRQCVVLGSGMDSRPWRLKLPASLKWFEVDRADVLLAKEQLLMDAGAEIEVLSPMRRSQSSNTQLTMKIGKIDHHSIAVKHPLRTFTREAVAADLGDASWAGELFAAGFDASKPTVWLAEGLLMYLQPERVTALLTELAGLSAPGSALLTVSVTDDVIADIKTKGTNSELMGTWQFGCPPDPRQWLTSVGWQAQVVATRASLAGALGLGADVCAFETDPSSEKNGRSLFIAASLLPVPS